jgi:AcrR family transcriptional regulator
MEVKPQLNARAAQGEATEKALRRHARKLFSQKSYAAAATDELVRRARVTKGALYHHFANKQELYRAVVEDMERELVVRIEAAAAGQRDPWRRLRAMCRAYLDACSDPSTARILVLEAPVVLGWKTWCQLEQENEVASFARCLGEVVQPPETMARVVLGALNTAVRVIATAEDAAAARSQVDQTIDRLLSGLRSA